MNPTWNWLITVAAWLFLIGTTLVVVSALPAVGKRSTRLMVTGFLLGITSFLLVLAAWGLPRLPTLWGAGGS